MSRLLYGLVVLLSLAGSAADAQLLTTQAGGAGNSGPLTITGIAISSNSFPAGAPAGAVVGTITAQTTGGSFGGNLSLSGTDAARFQITGSSLVTAGVLAAGSYNVGVTATQAGAVGSPFGPVAFGISGATGSTWNPADKSPDITLSNGNMTASAATAATWRAVRLTSSHNSGKYYFEVTATQATGAPAYGPMVGLGTASQPTSAYPGSSTNSYGFQCRPDISISVAYYNGGVLNTNQFDYCVTGDVMGITVDLGAKKIWINDWSKGTGWNHGASGAQDPATGAGGISISGMTGSIFPMFGGNFILGAPTPSMTINPGSSTFSGTVPAGFSSWN